jgi:3-hydroxyisobutyrate dehydrogenase
VVSRTFAAGFTTGLMAKDLRTASDVAHHLELNMPMLKRAVAYWADANSRLGAAADHTEIMRYAEMLAEEGP